MSAPVHVNIQNNPHHLETEPLLERAEIDRELSVVRSVQVISCVLGSALIFSGTTVLAGCGSSDNQNCEGLRIAGIWLNAIGGTAGIVFAVATGYVYRRAKVFC